MNHGNLTSTSRALYRVFVAPSLVSATPRRVANTHTHFASQLLLPRTTIRTRVFKKKDAVRTSQTALQDHYTFDSAIEAPYVNIVEPDGRFRQNVQIDDALRSLNKVTQHLVLVAPGKPDAAVDMFGRATNPTDLPTCKVFSKMELRQQLKTKLDIARRAAKGVGAGLSSKEIELNWAIEKGDLGHRLEKMKGFLNEGRKVEVILGPKHRGRVATTEECETLMRAIRDTVDECKGAAEVKEPEGVIGKIMTMVFEIQQKGAIKSSRPEEKPTESVEKKRVELADGTVLSKYALKQMKKEGYEVPTV